MKYVYIIKSLNFPDTYYTGITDNIENRLKKHNAGDVTHTSKFRPWALETYLGFSDNQKAIEFERYLKSGSGRAFAKKHL